MHDFGDLVDRLQRSGGGLGVHDGYNLGRLGAQRLAHVLGGENLAPRALDGAHFAAVAPGHIRQAQAEVAVDAYQHLVAGLHQVGDGGFHGGAAGARDRDGERVSGLKGVAQQLLGAVHQLQEFGIQVPYRGDGHGIQHARVDHAGARAEQDARRHVQAVALHQGLHTATAGTSMFNIDSLLLNRFCNLASIRNC